MSTKGVVQVVQLKKLLRTARKWSVAVQKLYADDAVSVSRAGRFTQPQKSSSSGSKKRDQSRSVRRSTESEAERADGYADGVDPLAVNYQSLLGKIRHLLRGLNFDEEAAALGKLMKRAKTAPYDAACHRKMQQLLARLQRLDMTERSLAMPSSHAGPKAKSNANAQHDIPLDRQTKPMSLAQGGTLLGLQSKGGTVEQRREAAGKALRRLMKSGDVRYMQLGRKFIFDNQQIRDG